MMRQLPLLKRWLRGIVKLSALVDTMAVAVRQKGGGEVPSACVHGASAGLWQATVCIQHWISVF
jgi:hypothetical protein